MGFRRLLATFMATLAAVLTISFVAASPASADPDMPFLGPGYANDPGSVTCVQEFFGLEMDGLYGQMTYDAVFDYQVRNGLTADGIVGPMTADMMMLDATRSYQITCGQYLPNTFVIADDNGNLDGGGTITLYNEKNVPDAGKSMPTCVLSGIKSEFIGTGRLISILRKRHLPTPHEWLEVPGPANFGVQLTACYIVGLDLP